MTAKNESVIPLVKATTDGVVLHPSEFSITLACLPSITATQELVVPKSIPITAPFTPSDLWTNAIRNEYNERNTTLKNDQLYNYLCLRNPDWEIRLGNEGDATATWNNQNVIRTLDWWRELQNGREQTWPTHCLTDIIRIRKSKLILFHIILDRSTKYSPELIIRLFSPW